MMPSPQAHAGLYTAPTVAYGCQHVPLAVAAFGSTACVRTASVAVADAVVAVIDAADMADVSCNKTKHIVPYSMCDSMHQAHASR